MEGVAMEVDAWRARVSMKSGQMLTPNISLGNSKGISRVSPCIPLPLRVIPLRPMGKNDKGI